MSLDDMKDMAVNLIPPHADLSKRFRYDLTVSLTLVSVIAVGGAHIAMACGFLTWMGLSGFAMASDVSSQQAQLTAIQVGQLNRDMRDAKRQVCLAHQQRSQAALNSWSMQLQQARGQYFAITHSWPDMQSCEELLVSGPSG